MSLDCGDAKNRRNTHNKRETIPGVSVSVYFGRNKDEDIMDKKKKGKHITQLSAMK